MSDDWSGLYILERFQVYGRAGAFRSPGAPVCTTPLTQLSPKLPPNVTEAASLSTAQTLPGFHPHVFPSHSSSDPGPHPGHCVTFSHHVSLGSSGW